MFFLAFSSPFKTHQHPHQTAPRFDSPLISGLGGFGLDIRTPKGTMFLKRGAHLGSLSLLYRTPIGSSARLPLNRRIWIPTTP